jgi:hypothetical protein
VAHRAHPAKVDLRRRDAAGEVVQLRAAMLPHQRVRSRLRFGAQRRVGEHRRAQTMASGILR